MEREKKSMRPKYILYCTMEICQGNEFNETIRLINLPKYERLD